MELFIFALSDLGPWSMSRRTLESWSTIVWNIIRSNNLVWSYGPDTDFASYVLWPWPWRMDIWTWVEVKTNPWVMDNRWEKCYQDQQCSIELWPGLGYWLCVHFDVDLGSKSWHVLKPGTTIVWNILSACHWPSSLKEKFGSKEGPICIKPTFALPGSNTVLEDIVKKH